MSEPIRAEFFAENQCVAEGITTSSALAMCRLFVAAGRDPETPLHCYRGDVLSLKIRSIGEGARITPTATGFAWRKEGDLST